MNPNIIIGNIAVPAWYLFATIGTVVAIALSIYLRPKDFPLRRGEIFILAVILAAASILGARILFLILHRDLATVRLIDLVSRRGGFAYFGGLVLSVLVLWTYAAIRKISFPALADYAISFLMLSQVFVRIGCFFAGCCYGKVTNAWFGVVFKSVDKLPRHPTQIYEAVMLVAIYVITRLSYEKRKSIPGRTFFTGLALYGAGRFFVEFLRTDSPAICCCFTLAQVACLSLALLALAFVTGTIRVKKG